MIRCIKHQRFQKYKFKMNPVFFELRIARFRHHNKTKQKFENFEKKIH